MDRIIERLFKRDLKDCYMTDGEKLLLAIVNRRDLKTLSKVRRHWLDGSEVVQHRFIVDYYKDSGEFVGAKAYCEKFGLDASEVDARPTYYLRIVRERYLFTRISEEIPKIVKGLKGDPNKKLSDLRTLVSSLSNDGMETKDVLYSDDTDNVVPITRRGSLQKVSRISVWVRRRWILHCTVTGTRT